MRFQFPLLALALCAAGAAAFAQNEEPADATKPGPPAAKPPVKLDFPTLSKFTGIKALPVPARPRLQRDAQPARAAWARRKLAEPALKRLAGTRHAESAGAFFKSAGDWWEEAPNANIGAVADAGGALWRDGCTDPAVLFVTGLAEEQRSGTRQARGYFTAAMGSEALAQQPGLRLRVIEHALASVQGDAARNEVDFLATLEQVLAKDIYRQNEAAVLLDHRLGFTDTTGQRKFAEKVIALIEKSALPAWVKDTWIGALEIEIAWRYRGSGYAGTVTEAGWKGFTEHLTRARTHLERAWNANPEGEFAPMRMITVEMGAKGRIEEMQKWFHRAIAARFDFAPAYAAFSNALLPRWHGSLLHLLTFAEACMDTGLYDTNVPWRFRSVLHTIADESPEWEGIFGDPEIHRRTNVLFEAEGRRGFADRTAERTFAGRRAVHAWIADDFARAAEIIEKDDPHFPFDGDAVGMLHRHEVGLTMVLCESRIFAGPAAADMREARARRDAREWKASRAAYERARDRGGKSVKNFIEGEIALVDFEEQLARGGWVKLPTPPGHGGWSRLAGDWKFEKDGRIVMNGEAQAARVLFEGRMPKDFELRGRYAMTWKNEKNARNAGVFFAHTPLKTGRRSATWFSFEMWQAGDGKPEISLKEKFYKPPDGYRKNIEFPPTATFRLRKHRGSASAWIDDRLIFEKLPLPEHDAEERPYIALGGVRPGNGLTVEFSDLEVRMVGEEL